MSRPRLYVIPASPPCACIEAALRRKGVAYDVTELPPVLHTVHQQLRFGAPTVPSLTLDGEKVTGSRRIVRRLEDRWPDPPLLGRPGVEEAERWGDEELQPVGRHVVWWALRHHPAAMPSFLARSALPLPAPAVRASAPVVTRLAGLRNGVRDDVLRADLASLPAKLDRIEAFAAEGAIGGDAPTAADLQIGAVLALLLRIGDVAEVIRGSAAATRIAERWFPDYPGHVPAGVLPAGWLSTSGRA